MKRNEMKKQQQQQKTTTTTSPKIDFGKQVSLISKWMLYNNKTQNDGKTTKKNMK